MPGYKGKIEYHKQSDSTHANKISERWYKFEGTKNTRTDYSKNIQDRCKITNTNHEKLKYIRIMYVNWTLMDAYFS